MEEVGARILDLWDGILDLTSKLVIPDWGALVALLPLLLLALVVLFFLSRVALYANLGPSHRGVRRVTPLPPPGVHAGSGSFAPVLAAIGVFLLFFGLIAGGWLLVAGVVVLILTLLYWGRESMREFDHIEPAGLLAAGGPATAGAPPPPGIHLPAPSFRPILVSIAVALLLLGLVFGAWLALGGVIALVITLLGWLHDAGREYHATVVADQTGHHPAEKAPGYPTGTLVAIVAIVVVAVVLNTGILPPGSNAAAGPGASPGAGGGTAGGGGASAAPSGGGASLPAADATITAQGIQFVTKTVTAPAGKPFTIAFDNEDAGVPHDVAIRKGSATGDEAFKGEIVTGPKVVVYDVPALEAGSYTFVCTVHPNMTGTLTVQ
jgi:plastocyanin